MIRNKIAATVLGVALAGTASAATIVENGSFESDPGSAGYNGGSYGSMNWDIWSSLPGWQSDYSPNQNPAKGIEVQTVSTLGLTPADGDYYVELDSNRNSSMWQTVELAIGKYQLTFQYSPRVDGPGTNGIGYAIDGVANGTINGPADWSGTSVGVWTTVTMDFTIATAGSYVLRFAANSGDDSYGGLIDDVNISAVPVPAAGLLLIGALGGLAALRRRKAA